MWKGPLLLRDIPINGRRSAVLEETCCDNEQRLRMIYHVWGKLERVSLGVTFHQNSDLSETYFHEKLTEAESKLDVTVDPYPDWNQNPFTVTDPPHTHTHTHTHTHLPPAPLKCLLTCFKKWLCVCLESTPHTVMDMFSSGKLRLFDGWHIVS